MLRLYLLSLVLSACLASRPIKIFMYQYIPDLANDFYASLTQKLEDQFFLDTGHNVTIVYSYDYNTYEHETIATALTTGGFDLVEADATVVDFLASGDYILAVPKDVDMSGFTDESIQMSEDSNGHLYMVPSYSCVNVMFSYDHTLDHVHNSDDLIPWVNARLSGHPEKIGWAADLGASVWDLRYTYIDSYLDSHKHDPLFPDAYSDDLDSDAVSVLTYLRDVCVDRSSTPHSNPCLDGTYYNDYGRYFGDFVSRRAVILQGFPEYLSNLLALDSTFPAITTAHLGDGDKNFVYTNGFVVSKSNCRHDCHATAVEWLNWQKINHGLITSLGLDLTPPRPRYLMWSWRPFYSLPQVKAYSQYAEYWKFQKKGIAIDTVHILETQDAQYNALKAAIVDGYTPP